jgi:hypothetical protein
MKRQDVQLGVLCVDFNEERSVSLDFYDSRGRPFAYSDDGETIFAFSGKPLAYVDGDSVYSFTGAHLGFFEQGQIWDHSGRVLLFTDGASGGPMKPLKALKPLKSLKQLKPLKGLKQLKPLKPLKSFSWSSIGPESHFA